MFPASTVEAAIRDEITAAANDRPSPRRAWEPEVDSLIMVRVALRIEEELALVLPDDIMPSGGFDSVEHCVAAVVEACRELWNASHHVSEEV